MDGVCGPCMHWAVDPGIESKPCLVLTLLMTWSLSQASVLDDTVTLLVGLQHLLAVRPVPSWRDFQGVVRHQRIK